jgi:hypothetical protein
MRHGFGSRPAAGSEAIMSSPRDLSRHAAGISPAKNPNGYCPNHATGVRLPDDFVVTPLQYVD